VSDATRRSHEATLRFDAPAREVFLRFCPVRERLGGEVVYSTSGHAEEDLVFRVPGGGDRPETIYVYAVHDPRALRIKVVGIRAGDRVTSMDIRVHSTAPAACEARVTLTRTGFSPPGSAAVARYDERAFHEEMDRWRADLGALAD